MTAVFAAQATKEPIRFRWQSGLRYVMVRVRVTVTFRVTPIRTVLRLGYSLGYGYGDVSRHTYQYCITIRRGRVIKYDFQGVRFVVVKGDCWLWWSYALY